MITSKELAHLSGQSGFRSDVLEKVLRLLSILDRLDNHPTTHGAWVLKGGTALNLFHLDVPRLSVDIDLNFTGAVPLQEMTRARPEFERALASCCEREGCSVRRAPSEHAGGKFRLRFPSLLGGSQNLEIDVSYVARVPLLGTERRGSRFSWGAPLSAPTLSFEELAAGKFTALIHRSAARDLFDAAQLTDLAPDLFSRWEFRLAFVCFMGSARNDVRTRPSPGTAFERRAVEQELVPMLRRKAADKEIDLDGLMGWIQARLHPALERIVVWSESERRFLDHLLDFGEIEAECLHPDPEIQTRVRQQPMLQWKAQNVRQQRRRI